VRRPRGELGGLLLGGEEPGGREPRGHCVDACGGRE
jgi:hypothetical protein